MKVMCIKDDWYLYGTSLKSPNAPSVGDIVTVVDVSKHPDTNGVFYVLQEYIDDGWFQADSFAHISDIDETEMVRENVKVETI